VGDRGGTRPGSADGRILAVDWVPPRPELPEGLIVIYDGGTLTGTEISAIRRADVGG
jgi:hypothetical protein